MDNKSRFSNSKDGDFLEILEQRVAENRADGSQSSGVLWKEMAAWLGVHPWRVLIPLAVLVAMGMAVVFRGRLLVLVSGLQGGF